MAFPAHRLPALDHLCGRGLEIGALHEPFPLPAGCQVQYADAISKDKAISLFPELNPALIVNPDFILDLDAGGLSRLGEHGFDFVIASHVLEHSANPIGALEQIFRVLKPGGVVVIAIPDMRFTFDRRRPVTTFEHVWSDYVNKVEVSSDDHYLEFLESAAPHVFNEPGDLVHHISRARDRREHAHAWTSDAFKRLIESASAKMGVALRPVFESSGNHNRGEYFSVWKKADGGTSFPAPSAAG